MALARYVNGHLRATTEIDADITIRIDNNTSISIRDLAARLEAAEQRIKDLETAYMEEKLLGSNPDKIGS